MHHYITELKKHRLEIALFISIISLGIFLRTYHFSDWLQFEVDQTYDTRIVSQAVQEGPANLILLGPTAGGGRALRLGPAFYYLEYIGAEIFGDTPAGHASTVLIFSILSLPLFYFFARLYFSKQIFLALLIIFSTSCYAVLYSRFSWSPNVLPFLILFSFYALLRSVATYEKKKDQWFLIATVAGTITTQIHFNAFFTLPAIIILFLLYVRPSFNWKTWLSAIAIILSLYSSMILSDIQTRGENLKFFVKKISKENSDFSNVQLRLTQTLQYASSEFFLINSGIDHINGGYIKTYGFQNDSNLKWRMLAILLLLIETALLIWNFFREKNRDRKNFLLLLFLWFFISFAYFFSLISDAFHMYPRFFLITSPLAIFFSGFILQLIPIEKKRLFKALIIAIIGVLFFSNITKIKDHFKQLSGSSQYQQNIDTEDIFPNTGRLTLREQLEIVAYIQSKYQKNNYPVYLDAKSDYETAFWYHLNKLGIQYYDEIHDNPVYKEANYFIIQYNSKGTMQPPNGFTIRERKNFGILDVYMLSPKSKKISDLRQSDSIQQKLEQVTQISKLLTWKDLFHKQNNIEKH